MIRIAHISDIHMTQNGEPIWGVDVKRNFDLAIAKISQLASTLDAIFISGDLSNDGTIESYKYVDDAFKHIGVPTYACAGNHDNVENMDFTLQEGFIKTHCTALIQDWKFIFINSVVPDEDVKGKNKSRGRLSYESLKNLEDEIAKDGKNTAIILHHPPIEPGGWLNRKLLDNREEFNDSILKFLQVKMVLYGHTHYNLQTYINGVIYTAPSAIGFAFDKDLQKFEIAPNSEGFNIISLNNNKINIEGKSLK